MFPLRQQKRVVKQLVSRRAERGIPLENRFTKATRGWRNAQVKDRRDGRVVTEGVHKPQCRYSLPIRNGARKQLVRQYAHRPDVTRFTSIPHALFG